MQTFIQKSIKARIFLAILLPLALVEGFLLYQYIDHINQDFSFRYEAAASTISSPFISSIEKKLETLDSLKDKKGFLEIYADLKGAIEFPLWLDEYKTVTGIAIVDETGRQLAATQGAGNLVDVEFATARTLVSSVRREAFFAVSVPVQTDSTSVGYLLFRFSDKDAIKEEQAALLLVGLMLFLSLLFSSVLAWLISTAITRPINTLAVDSESLAAGHLEHEICALNSTDEIGLLARNFRLMRDSIREKLKELEEKNYALSKEIIERKRGELALLTQEAQLRTLFESIPDLIWLKNPEGVYLSCNQKFERFYGAKEFDIIGKTDYDFVDKELADFFRAHDLAAMSAGMPSVNEEEVRYADDGHKELLETVKTPLFDPDGKLIGVLGIARDITARKRSEADLRASEERYRTLFEKSSDANLIIEEDRFVDCNQATVEMLCFRSKNELLQTHPSELSPEYQPDERPSFVKANEMIAIAFKRGSHRFEWEHKRANGEVFPVEVLLTAIPHQGQQILHVVWRDITERKRAESELLQLRNYLSNIIDSMPSVLIGVDCAGRVTQWNREAWRLTGVAATDVMGHPLDQAIPRLAAEMELIHEALRTRQEQTEPKRSYQQDGETRYEDLTIYPLIADGIEGAVIRLDDVTARVRIEEMMVQNEKMLSVGGLAAGMAHEINNPLAGMIQSATVLRNRLTGDMPANERAATEAGTTMAAIRTFHETRGATKMLGQICESGARAAEIVSNMLNFARKETGARSSHNLTELIDRSIDLASSDFDLQKKHDFRDIEIIREYENDLPLIVCEVGTFQQVILNLLRNANDAMQERKVEGKKPRITLRVAYVESAGMVQIEIEDNGPGMDDVTCKRIFEPFFTTKAVGHGTGLGLSVSYFIITESHAGEMSVESQPGQGTKFIIRLPAAK